MTFEEHQFAEAQRAKQEQDAKFSSIIARALERVDAEELRGVVADVLRDRLGGHDCKQIIEAAIQPVLRQMLAELLKDSSVLQILQDRVRSQAMQLMGNMTLSVGRY